MFRISRLARMFGLSRSTLLYYDRIGLLTPTGRSESGYRLYSQNDRERLAAICDFRRAGLTTDDISRLLALEDDADGAILKRRMGELSGRIRTLQAQQRLLAGMLRMETLGEVPSAVDKKTWIEMLRAAGMDESAMERWHTEFERRAPEAHHQFLLDLGVSEEEALQIRHRSKNI